jgi:chromosome segregation and condensation protein ScpB
MDDEEFTDELPESPEKPETSSPAQDKEQQKEKQARPRSKDEKKLIEAALFISSRAMSLEEFRALTGIGALGYLQGVVEELRREYAERGSAIEISELSGKYEMRISNDVLQRVKQFAQDIEISKSALRTLAYISKHDGILKSELVRKIGTQIYEDVHELIDAEFVKATKAGRTSKITLTEKFKKYFVMAPKVEAALETPIQQTTL